MVQVIQQLAFILFCFYLVGFILLTLLLMFGVLSNNKKWDRLQFSKGKTGIVKILWLSLDLITVFLACAIIGVLWPIVLTVIFYVTWKERQAGNGY